jgi:hypothetical protein
METQKKNYKKDNLKNEKTMGGKIILKNPQMGTFAETQQSSIIVYRLPTKENKFPFPFPLAENKRKFTIFVFHLQQTNRSLCFPLVPCTVCGIYRYTA